MNRNTKSNTKRIVTMGVFGLLILSLVPLSAQAGRRGGREPSPDRAVARLTQRLDLTAEQQDQVRQILEESFEKRREMWEARRGEREALREETHERLAEVLTSEQMEELRKLRDERREHRRDRGWGKGCWDDQPVDD